MTYFRDYARKIGCDVDSLGDLAVWNYIRAYQGKSPVLIRQSEEK